MSMRANPTAIGLFLLGVLVIAIAGTAVLASATWFQQRTTFVSFFPESVNGLENGAPVKFQGVPVGSVTESTSRSTSATTRSRCRSSTKSTCRASRRRRAPT
jgi:paraquat-inducible protein B